MDKTLLEKYQTGVLWQDYQHKQLIDLFEKIQQARQDNKDESLYRYTIAFLAMYVNHHFKLEEQYMKKYNYPDSDGHIKEHKKFIKELKAFRNDNETYSSQGGQELLTRIGEWVLGHILDVDKHLGKFILDYEKGKKLKHG